jgi:methyl halide transferase
MTDWEKRYLAGDTPWEKGGASPALFEVLAQTNLSAWGTGQILVPGCGFGHDVRVLAQHGLAALGLDLSETAVARAEKFSCTGSEQYEVGNFLDPDWRKGRRFTGWWEHTCFCAIAPADREKYVESAAECITEGGLLAGVFFINPYDPGEERLGPPHGVTVEEVKLWFAPWFTLVEDWVPKSAYAGREGREWVGIFRKLPQL